jgi:hypothetical protein
VASVRSIKSTTLVPSLRARAGRIRFCWPWGPDTGWDVEAIFHQYGIKTFGRGWPDGWYWIEVSAGQVRWVKHVLSRMGVPWVCGDGTWTQNPQPGKMPVSWGRPVKHAGFTHGLFMALVGDTPEAQRIARESRKERERRKRVRAPREARTRRRRRE